MDFEPNFDEKIDVIDLIINVLKDHESKLDELVSRLENMPIHRPGERLEDTIEPRERREPSAMAPRIAGRAITLILKRWTDFTETGSSAEIVAFDTEKDVFEVAAYTGGIAYIYRENVPSMAMLYKSGEEGAQIEEIDISSPGLLPAALKGKMECGLEFTRRDVESKRDNGQILHQIIYELDPNVTRSWIAYQLGIEDSKVFQGKLQL